METELLVYDRAPVRLASNIELAAIRIALSYVGGVIRWNVQQRQLEILFPFSWRTP